MMDVYYFVTRIYLKSPKVDGKVITLKGQSRLIGVEYILPENFSMVKLGDLVANKLSEVGVDGLPHFGEAEDHTSEVIVPWEARGYMGEVAISIEIRPNLTKRLCSAINSGMRKIA